MKTIVVVFLFSSVQFPSSVFSQGLVFQNPKLISGQAGADKAVYRFPNVKSGVDALVTIMGRSSNKVELVNIDVTSSGHPLSFQPQITYNDGSAPKQISWHMDFDVVLVKAGTTTKVIVDEIDCTAIDIDGNGDKIREFIVFTDPINVTYESGTSLVPDELPVIDFVAENGDPVRCGTCTRSSAIILCNACNGAGLINIILNGIITTNNCTKCNGSGKLHTYCGHPYVAKKTGKSVLYTGPTTNYTNIDTNATVVMVTGTWLNSSEVFFRLGGENIGNNTQGAADRLYSLWFKSFRYQVSTFLPVTLIDWKAEYVKTSVNLKWTSTLEKNAKEYIIERSFDGYQYNKIGVVSAGGNSENRMNYSFSDNKVGNHDGMIYYRLKSADIDGKMRVSEIRTVRTGKSTQMSIVAYPNPVINELKVTVPSNWQGKKVMYEIYTVNGSVAAKMLKESAAVTESLPVSSLRAGTYVVKVSSGTESAIQQVIKSN